MAGLASNDLIKLLGDAALSAAGAGFATGAWESAFNGPTAFSSTEVDQMQQVFAQVIAAAMAQQDFQDFYAYSKSLNEYATDPTEGTLPNILTQTNDIAQRILANGYGSARLYISAALLHITALGFQANVADVDKAGATANVVAAYTDMFVQLAALEAAYGAAVGMAEYVAFKEATVFGGATMPDDAVAAFGDDYVIKTGLALATLKTISADALSNVPQPLHQVMIVPYDAASTPVCWTCKGDGMQLCCYKCQRLPASVPDGFLALGDLAVAPNPVPPSSVAYIRTIAAGSTFNNTPQGYVQIYNDAGSGQSMNYSGFDGLNTDKTANWTIGTYSASSDSAGVPDNPEMCWALPEFDTPFPVTFGDQMWNDAGSGAHEDGQMYRHPQFGDFGVYNLFRSHSRPSPATVNGMNWLSLAGFNLPS